MVGARRTAVDPASPRFTTRETQIVAAIAGGCSSREIAAGFGRAIKTIDAHIQNAMRKLAVHDRKALVKVATERGLISK